MAAVVIGIRKRNRATLLASKYSQRLSDTAVVRRVSTVLHIDTEPELGCLNWRRYQKDAEHLYNHLYVQVFVAGLIVSNFLCNIVQAQIDPKGNKFPDTFAVFEWFFNIVFLFELILNMYSCWFKKFWKSSWNVFDFFVVSIGWMFQLELPLPGPMKLLRMMRAFRVFRLFKRIESLRKILSSLGKAVPGVMNAFLIQLIIISIFAIIAVDRFRDYGEGGQYINEYDEIVEFQTARGQDYGFEYYGDFGKALFTMFQVVTGESWSEAVTRPLFNSNSPTTSTGSCFFFVLFCLLNGVVLINVVVAVLLEKMVDEPASVDEDGEAHPDPMETKVDAMKDSVNELKTKMNDLMRVQAGMQKRAFNVDIIKDQVAALLAHEQIQVQSRIPDAFPEYQGNDWKPSYETEASVISPEASVISPISPPADD